MNLSCWHISSNGPSKTSLHPWSINSWRTKPVQQQPHYKDQNILDATLKTISSLPPLVLQAEIEELKGQLAQVAKGERFLLQAGDCAERFVDCNENSVANRLKTLIQMSMAVANGGLPVVVIGRVAGQYAKPRSVSIEKLPDGRKIKCFRGDNVNGFDLNHREHDPTRLLAGYFHSAATLNYIRALTKTGFAELPVQRSRCEEITPLVGLGEPESLIRFDHFTSHEGLILGYEEALTRFVPRTKLEIPSDDVKSRPHGRFYNFGAHFLWIGKRTRSISDAHVEYFRGISNPIGIKIDSELSAQDLIHLLETLDPNRIPGRVTLISRFGYEKIVKDLPERIKAVQAAGRGETVVWCCDPMHGNTYTTSDGIKTRNFDHVLSELTATLKVLGQHNSRLGGVHLEVTGEDVTECIGGPQGIDESQLNLRYSTCVDPRLNYMQSLEISFLLANQMKNNCGE